MKRYLLVLFFFGCLFYAKSQKQDLIITTNGFKIYCKIVKEDSLSLFYNIANHLATLEIKKTEVKEYYYDIIRQKERKTDTPDNTEHRRRLSEDMCLFTLSAGLAFPNSDFADMDATSEKAGLAKPGYLFQVAFTFKFTKNIGICAAYDYQLNRMATELITQQYVIANPGLTFSTTATKWAVNGFFGGVYLEKQFKSVKGLSVFLTAMAGKPKFRSPEIITTVTTPGFIGSVKTNAATASALGIIIGPGLFYKFNNDAGLCFNLNYLNGEAVFSNVVISNGNMTQAFDFRQKFSSINAQISFVICIKK